MAGQAPLEPGRTYMLRDYTLVQVVAVAGDRVRYLKRRWTWRGRQRTVVRNARLRWLASRVRAEVNGEFFPGFNTPGTYVFRHAEEETERLHGFLADRAPHRPFSAGA